MTAVLLLGGTVALLFALALSARAAGWAKYKSPAINELAPGELARVTGIAQPHEPPVPSPLDPRERILWCHAILSKSRGVGRRGPPATETRKAATWFRLVDKNDDSQSVLVDGHRLNHMMVSLDPDPDEVGDDEPAAGAQTNPLMVLVDVVADLVLRMHAANIKIIRPGDRLWITGRARETAEGLCMHKIMLVDNVSPEIRAERDRSGARGLAMIGAPLFVIGGLMWLLAG
jgi:hypothetical protein